MAELFGVIGGIVAITTFVAWRVRFHGQLERTVPVERANLAVREQAPLSVVPLPPSDFISAVEGALGQRVVLVRLRTPSNVFKLEVPGQTA